MNKETPEYRLISTIIPEGSTVLDMGCGEGKLLSLLATRRIRGQGIEIDRAAIAECVRRGVSVLFGDLDHGLSEYPDKIFDFVILNNCLPETRHPQKVLREALRVGKHVLVGLPNFCYYRARFQFCFKGVAPVTRALPYRWYDGPNLHFLSARDFINYCRQKKIRLQRAYYLAGKRRVRLCPNLLADYALFLLQKKPA